MAPGSIRFSLHRLPVLLVAGLATFGLASVRCSADISHSDQPEQSDQIEQPVSNGPSLSENISDQFEALKPLVDAKQYDAALSLLASMAALVADPNSYQGGYDMAVILDTKAKTLVEADRLGEAIAPWEETLSLVQRHPSYFYKHQVTDIVHYLAQIYSQLATGIKLTPGPDLAERQALQRDDFNKALSYMQRWLGEVTTATQDDQLFYADMLFNLAASSSGDDAAKLLKESEAQAEKGLRMAVNPHDEFYYLVAAACEQNGDLERAADYLEILVRRNPKNREYSPQLMSIYLNLAASPKEKLDSRSYYLRAINAIERAQAHGIMNDQKTNLDLVTIYYDMNQYGQATELLSAGLKSGAINPTESNWQILAYSYQQINQNDKAIETYKDAAELYPDDGQLDYSIALIYYQQEDLPNAYTYFSSAAKKGHLSSLYGVYIQLASIGFEINKLDEALAACDAAAQLPEAAKDAQLPQLRSAIEDKIKEQAKIKTAGSATPL